MSSRLKLKQNNSILKVICAMLIAGVFLSLGGRGSVVGQATDDLQQQKDAKQQQLLDVQSQINNYQAQIKAAQGQINTLANQIKILNLQIVETQAEITATQDKIDAANLEIADVSNQIVQTQQQIEKERDILKTLLADINDLDQQSPLEIALANDNFQQFLDQVQYDDSIQQQSQQTLTKIKVLKSQLDQRQADLKVQQTNLTALSQQLNATNASLTTQQKGKQQLVNATKGQEKNYQKLLSDSQEQQKDLNDEINDLDNQIAAKLGNNILAPHHGLLDWPLQGTMTQGYGNTGFTALGYSFHNGIDIAAPAGAPIHAAGDGTVIATGNATASGEDGAYGNWVAIKHDTGSFAAHPIITLYGHMRNFVLKTGQVVKDGDLVGYEGNTGNTTRILYGPSHGYHLHFTVFDAQGFGVAQGAHQNTYGPYTVPYGATYNPLDFL